MALLEINIPIEVVEAHIVEVYGANSPVEVQDVFFDGFSNDIVFKVYLDDDAVEEQPIHNWNVTTTMDFLEGIL